MTHQIKSHFRHLYALYQSLLDGFMVLTLLLIAAAIVYAAYGLVMEAA